MRNYKEELKEMYAFLEDVQNTQTKLLEIKKEKKEEKEKLFEYWKNSSENKKESLKKYIEEEKKIHLEDVEKDIKYHGLLIDSIKECIVQLAYNVTIDNMYHNIDKLDGQLIRYKKVQKILLDGLEDQFYISTDTNGLYYNIHWKNDYNKKETIYYTENYYDKGKFESYIDKKIIEKRTYSYYREYVPSVNQLKEHIATLENDIKKCIEIQAAARQQIENIKGKYIHCTLYNEFDNNNIKL